MAKRSKTRKVAVSFSASLLAMAAMLATNQAEVTIAPCEGGTDLGFRFAARQQFTLTFQGDRLVGASMNLVVGCRQSVRAMQVVYVETDINIAELHEGLAEDDNLRVAVKGDDGHSLEEVRLTLADVAEVDETFAAILRQLLTVPPPEGKSLGDLVEGLRQQLTQAYEPIQAAA